MLPLTVKLRALQEADEVRWANDGSRLGSCEGYAVWDEDGRLGTVARTRPRDSQSSAWPRAFAVRTGLFRHRVVLISATEVDHTEPDKRRITLKPPPPGTHIPATPVDAVAVAASRRPSPR